MFYSLAQQDTSIFIIIIIQKQRIYASTIHKTWKPETMPLHFRNNNCIAHFIIITVIACLVVAASNASQIHNWYDFVNEKYLQTTHGLGNCVFISGIWKYAEHYTRICKVMFFFFLFNFFFVLRYDIVLLWMLLILLILLMLYPFTWYLIQ